MSSPGRASVTQLHVLRVFIGPDGRGGNPLGVFLEARILPDRRQAVAASSASARPSSSTARRRPARGSGSSRPAGELPFAGHPTVGTAWLLARAARRRRDPPLAAGDVPTWRDGERTLDPGASGVGPRIPISTSCDRGGGRGGAPPQMGSPGRYVWAWIDEPAGPSGRATSRPTSASWRTRRRGGSGAAWAAGLARPLVIRQGVGSEIRRRAAGRRDGRDRRPRRAGRCPGVRLMGA